MRRARTIAEGIERLRIEEIPRHRHPQKALSNLRAIEDFAGQRPLTDIPEVAREYRVAHPELSIATQNRRIAVLRRVMRLALRRWGWLTRELEVVQLPEYNQRHRYLTLPEVARLLLACDHLPTRDAVTLAVYSGMRQGEIFGLRRSDVQGDCLMLKDSKNRDPRVVPILPQMRAAVGRLPLPCRARSMYLYYQRACSRAGLEDLTFHDLRHTTASILINAGYNLKVVQEVLGHRTLAAANRYAHLSVATKRAALLSAFGAGEA